MERLSDLERATLGLLHVGGPSTAYAVRREFETSRSSHWSGSSGSIYPLLRRLEDKGLVASEPMAKGRRKGRLYRLTRDGEAAFLSWLRTPVVREEARLTYDLIRTRTYFLGSLAPAERRAFLDQAEEQIAAELEESRRALAEDGTGELEALAALGGVRVLEARLAWVREIRTRLDDVE